MTADILASGSRGNCTVLQTADRLILIDCGISCAKTLAKLGGRLPDAIFLTHEHGDHSAAVKQFAKRGVDIYATLGTFDALELSLNYNTNVIVANETYGICDFCVTPIKSIHDAKEPVNFIFSDSADRLLFVTDTGAIPQVEGNFSKIFIEANYSEPELLSSGIDAAQRRRILQNHMSIEQAEIFLRKHHAPDVRLLHISKRHGKEDEFYERIGRISDERTRNH